MSGLDSRAARQPAFTPVYGLARGEQVGDVPFARVMIQLWNKPPVLSTKRSSGIAFAPPYPSFAFFPRPEARRHFVAPRRKPPL